MLASASLLGVSCRLPCSCAAMKASTSASFSARYATGWRTGRTSPSLTTIRASRPASVASTSMVALSVSISKMMSPFLIVCADGNTPLDDRAFLHGLAGLGHENGDDRAGRGGCAYSVYWRSLASADGVSRHSGGHYFLDELPAASARARSDRRAARISLSRPASGASTWSRPSSVSTSTQDIALFNAVTQLFAPAADRSRLQSLARLRQR